MGLEPTTLCLGSRSLFALRQSIPQTAAGQAKSPQLSSEYRYLGNLTGPSMARRRLLPSHYNRHMTTEVAGLLRVWGFIDGLEYHSRRCPFDVEAHTHPYEAVD